MKNPKISLAMAAILVTGFIACNSNELVTPNEGANTDMARLGQPPVGGQTGGGQTGTPPSGSGGQTGGGQTGTPPSGGGQTGGGQTGTPPSGSGGQTGGGQTGTPPSGGGTSTGTVNYGSIMLQAFKNYGASNVTATLDGDYLVVTTTTVPDHKSPYFATTDARYEANTNAGFRKAPNSIVSGNVTFRIPVKPGKSASANATAGGPIGVALNGVPFFNQYAANNQPLTNEIVGFDQYGGHPQQQGQYHYHVEPKYMTTKKGKGALLGFLLDGFPVYGAEVSGKTITSKDLDSYHGRTAVTPEYPNGIYHYVVTADDPYINGSGYYGTPGTVTR